jgi:IclR family transcriptional regulator, pca regulon regulatory protein
VSRDAAVKTRDRETVASLSRGLRVIEAFNEGGSHMTQSEVARRASIPPAAARRYLRTLVSLGYIYSVDRHYLLSARVLSLRSAYLRGANIESVMMPELRRLVRLFGDTTGIAMLLDTNIVYVAHHCTRPGLRPVAAAGVTYPAHPTSLGRVLLAALSKRKLEEYFVAAKFEKLTKFTEVNPKRLRAILGQVRKQGYATVVDQLFYGVTSLTVPILGSNGKTIAALNTSTYTVQMSVEDLIKTRLLELRRSAEELQRIVAAHPALQQALQTAPQAPLIAAAS